MLSACEERSIADCGFQISRPLAEDGRFSDLETTRLLKKLILTEKMNRHDAK
jgi:hypothetical protein